MESFLLVFIPLFVAIDPFGLLPMFIALTEKFSRVQKRQLALQAVATALGIGICFSVGGHYIFSLLGITAADFRIAGGLLLLIFSIREIFGHSTKLIRANSPESLQGIVPLGTPLIAGPAMITTVLILHDEHGLMLILSGLMANLLIVLWLFVYSDRIIRLIGPGMSKVMAKVIAIFLAAIGIMMIRRGIEEWIFR